MKKILYILLFIPLGSFAQNIIALNIWPENPSENDFVSITVEYLFSNSDCLLNSKSVSVNDFDIIASTNHCIGPFEAECSTIEVFELGQLNEGEYSFKIYSSHGNYFYESESDTVCTPGIIPSSIDSTSFFVMSQMNLEQHQEKLFDSDFIMIDVLGRQHIEHKRGTLLFYIYDNGVVEKKFTP